nr:hypothetical protein [Streptomyces vinaceus]
MEALAGRGLDPDGKTAAPHLAGEGVVALVLDLDGAEVVREVLALLDVEQREAADDADPDTAGVGWFERAVCQVPGSLATRSSSASWLPTSCTPSRSGPISVMTPAKASTLAS